MLGGGLGCRACLGGVARWLAWLDSITPPAHPHPQSSLPRRSLRFALAARCAGLRPSGSRCRGCLVAGGSAGWVVRFIYTARPPPPVVLPAAPGASLGLGGASRRASPYGLALPPVGWWACWSCLPMEGREKKRDMGRSRRVSDNRQDSTPLRLARAPRRGLRGLGPQSIRPPLQAEPFDAAPCRAFFRVPVATRVS